MIPDPPARAHRADAVARSTAILVAADPADRPNAGGAGIDRLLTAGDVVLVDARNRSAEEVRRALGAVTGPGPRSAPGWSVGVLGAAGDALVAAVQGGATYVVDVGGAEPADLAAVAQRDVVVVVGGNRSVGPEVRGRGRDVTERHRAVLAQGAQAGAVVLEVPLGSGMSAPASQARRDGCPVGVVVEGPVHERRLDVTATAPGDVERGREIALLTADLVAGVATVRTSDAQRARRVRAVVAWLVGSAGDGSVDLIDAVEGLGDVAP